MQAKDFMEQVRRAEEELKLIYAKRAHYQELATMTSSSAAAVAGNVGNTSRVETAAVNIADLTTALDVKEAEYVKLIENAERLIDKIPQYKFRQVLTLHYLAGMKMADVGVAMDYKDDKSVYHVRGFALRELQKLM